MFVNQSPTVFALDVCIYITINNNGLRIIIATFIVKLSRTNYLECIEPVELKFQESYQAPSLFHL